PELRGTGANQTIDQLKLYGTAVRWFCEAGVPEERPGQVAYWRSLACRAWACASGALGGSPGPVHVNIPLREPLVPDPALAGGSPGAAGGGGPEPRDGRPDGAPWTAIAAAPPAGMVIPARRAQDETATRSMSHPPGPGPSDVTSTGAAPLDVPWTERGVLVCGDGGYDAAPLLRLAEEAGWPVLAEPSSGARRGPNALSAYQYLLDAPEFLAGHRPDLIVSAGRPGLSRGQAAFLSGPSGDRRPAAGGAEAGPAPRHVVVAPGPGRWAAGGAASTRLVRAPEPGPPAGSWLSSWLAADAAARLAADAVLGADGALTEPRLARDLAAALPSGSLLWVASSLP